LKKISFFNIQFFYLEALLSFSFEETNCGGWILILKNLAKVLSKMHLKMDQTKRFRKKIKKLLIIVKIKIFLTI